MEIQCASGRACDEALHYCLGHHVADPSRRFRSYSTLTGRSSSRASVHSWQRYAVEHPLFEPCVDPAARPAGIPRRWEWIVDAFGRAQDFQPALFPGLRSYYLASDRLLSANRARTYIGSPLLGYAPTNS
jgi:hypothetical protein